MNVLELGTFLEHQGFSDDAIDGFFLEHFGKKGMKWGVRKQLRREYKAKKQSLGPRQLTEVQQNRKVKNKVELRRTLVSTLAASAAATAGALYVGKLLQRHESGFLGNTILN